MPRRGKNWSDYETASLLRVWKDNLQELRSAKRNRKVYMTMADALQAMDISRGPEEIMERMRTMTKIYKKERMMATHRGGSSRAWVFYDEMDSLLTQVGVDCDVSFTSQSPELPDYHASGAYPLNGAQVDASDCEDEKFTEACSSTREHGVACDVLIDTPFTELTSSNANDSTTTGQRDLPNSKCNQTAAASSRSKQQKTGVKTTNDRILELLQLQLQSYNRMAEGLMRSAQEMIKMQQTIVQAIQADTNKANLVPSQTSDIAPQSRHASPPSTSESTGDSADFHFHQR